MKFAIALLCLVGVASASKIRYDGFQVIRLVPTSQSQVDALHQLEELNGGYDFWSGPGGINQTVDVMVPPHLIYNFKDFAVSQNLDATIFIGDVQEKIDAEKPKTKSARFNWVDYYRMDEIYDWLDELAAIYPDKVSVIVGGRSYEGREIRGVRVSFSAANENNAVFIEGGIHAREWISPAVATYILNQILTSTDASVRAMAERYDWYIFPVFNADGYEYTHTTNRMWRKTRVPYFLCHGADPNRNWAYNWMSGGASTNPCSDTYAGPRAFSEPSTESMAAYISTIQDKLTAYISFHSYSQLLLIPYGHSAAHLDNYDELYEIGLKAATSLASRYGTRYVVGNIVEAIYIASGGSMDWVKGTYKTRITYTYELRDTGRYGFLLPAEQIVPTSEETLDSLITILDEFNNKV